MWSSGDIEFYRAEELLALTWMDKREVTMLTTMHTASMEDTGKVDRVTNRPIRKPKVVLDYNKYMGGVDCSDMLTNTYADAQKSIKSYKKLVFHLTDLSVTNAFIMFKSVTGNSISHVAFVKEIAKFLISVQCLSRPIPKRPGRQSIEIISQLQFRHSNHWPCEIQPKEGAKKLKPTKICLVCSSRNKRSETRYECKACKVALHIDSCFEAYHTVQNFA